MLPALKNPLKKRNECVSHLKFLLLNKELNYSPTLVGTGISMKNITLLLQHVSVSEDNLFLLSRKSGKC